MMRCRSSIAALIFSLGVLSTELHAQTSYRLTLIETDPPSDQTVFATDLSDKGLVVGLSDANIIANRHAFAWRHGHYRDLHGLLPPTALISTASGTNNRADIVGMYFDGARESNFSFLLRHRRFVLIETTVGTGGVSVSAEDINNRRQVTGETFDFGRPRGFVWDRGRVTILPAFTDTGNVTVMEINDHGVVVGTVDDAVGGDFVISAAIWRNGQPLDLGLPPGWLGARGNAINNLGQVVGNLIGANRGGAFLWQRGDINELPTLDGALASGALDINDRGEIVGTTGFAAAPFAVATLWDDEGIHDLNDLISRDDPLQPFVTLLVAQLSNDRGRIVARGTDSRQPDRTATYLLTPQR
jgi:probable HAF family extracellular repeat protein